MRKIEKDVECIDLLHHWNSEEGEGKGETHEVLEHRLRQMGKVELADWLGKTIFRELAEDLNRSLDKDLDNFITETRLVLKQPIQKYSKCYNSVDYHKHALFLYIQLN